MDTVLDGIMIHDGRGPPRFPQGKRACEADKEMTSKLSGNVRDETDD